MIGKKVISVVSSVALAASLCPVAAFASVHEDGAVAAGDGVLRTQAAATLSLNVTRAATGKATLKKDTSYKLGVSATSGAKLSYKSSKTKVATVSEKGTVKAKKAGTATITVKAKKSGKTKTKKVKVTVVKASKYKKVKKLTASVAKKKLAPGASVTVKVAFNPKKASNKNLTFKSSKPSVANVSAKGVVTAKKAGSAKITVTSCANSKAKASVTITVKAREEQEPAGDGVDEETPDNAEEFVGYDVDSDGDGYSDYIENTFMCTDPYVANTADEQLEDKVVYDETAQRVEESQMDGIDPDAVARSLEASGEDDVRVVVPTGSADYSPGQVVVVEPCAAYPAGASVKVEATEDNGDDTVTLVGSAPELSEVVTYSNIDEELQPDWDAVRAADGVEVELEDVQSDAGEQPLVAQSAKRGLSASSMGGKVNPLKKKATFKFGSDDFDKYKDDVTSEKSGIDISGSVTVSIDDVRFALEVVPNYTQKHLGFIPSIVKDSVDLRRLYVDVDGDVEFKLTGTLKDSTQITLGEIPVFGGLGEGVFVKVVLVGSASGMLQVKLTVDYEAGVDYVKDSEPKLIGDFSNPDVEVTSKVEFQFGPEIRPVVALLGLELLAVGANAGVQAQVSGVMHSNPPMMCVDVGAWVFASVYAEAIKDIKWVDAKVSHDFWKESNSPESMKWHFENDGLVDACTWVAAPGNVDTEIDTGAEVRDGLADYSWSELKEISGYIAAADSDEEGLAIARRYHLTDANGQLYDPQHPLARTTKPVTLSDGTETAVEILGFRHDDLAGGGKAGITFGFADIPLMHAMNESYIETGNGTGWESSELRAWLNTDFCEMLPADLRPLIVEANKRTNNAGRIASESENDTSCVTETADKLWLLSSVECVYPLESEWQNVTYSLGTSRAEGKPYKLYTDGWTQEDGGHSTHKTGGYFSWWLRSPYGNDGVSFYHIDQGGSWSFASSDHTFGVSPGFCL